ncbi:SURF1 family protein [Pseudomonadota bacterium AL_CKDN230030165-1A_HGKHYDSX7]
MAFSHSRRKTILALLLLAVVIAVTVSMGRWQLRRADERRAVAAAIDAGRQQAPLALAAGQDAAVYVPWRAAEARGTWRPELSVWLENRNHHGRPGYWLATPLMLDEGRKAVLVLRGWVARQPGSQQAPAIPADTGPLTVSGELAERVPRLFELWSFGGAGAAQLPARLGDGPAPVLQNLDLAAYARVTGLTLLPTVLMQTAGSDEPLAGAPAAGAPAAGSPAAGSMGSGTGQDGAGPPRAGSAPRADGLVRDWPQPSVDYNQNQGYALQWFSFAAIAALAWLVVAGRAWKRARQRPNAPP